MVKRLSDRTNLETASLLFFFINLDKRNRLTVADDGQEIVRHGKPGDDFFIISFLLCYRES